MDQNDNPWWIVAEVCEILGIVNTYNAVRPLDDDEKNTVYLANSIRRGNPNRLVISESGLYKLIMRSDKPEAQAFQSWIAREVVPQIRIGIE